MSGSRQGKPIDVHGVTGHLLGSIDLTGAQTGGNPLALAQAIDAGVRTIGLLAYEKLVIFKEEFPDNIQVLMALPDREIELARDAFISADDFISYIDLLDLISVEELPCIAPHLHRGWQDKTQSCREVRCIAVRAIGHTLDQSRRDRLLRAAAIQQRVFAVPAPVLLSTTETQQTLAALFDLLKRLIPPTDSELTDLLNRVVGQLKST